MSRKRLLTALLTVMAATGAWFLLRVRSSAPEVRFIKPARQTLVSELPTNGKVEPIEWVSVRVDAPGLVERLAIHQGQIVAKGTLLAQLSAPGQTDLLRAAQARVAQSQADLATLNGGGRSAELTDIQNQLARTKFDRDQANKEYGSLRRLNEKQAATMVEVEVAHARVQQLDIQLQSLDRQRAAIVGKPDLAASEARVREAQATVQSAQAKLGQGTIRSPLAGEVYDLPARQGSYLNAGDLVASIGQLDRLRVRVYVDEPELGRVAVGLPVKITWDALPSKSWTGKVERLPTEISALGTRQVGEVLCTIDNPGRELVPGTNINAFIQISLVPNALTLPKEAIQRRNGMTSVFVLNGASVHLRRVEVGAFNMTLSQIVGGLRDSDSVALPGDLVMKDGERVKPI